MNNEGANNLFPVNGDNQSPKSPAAPQPDDNFASSGVFQSQFNGGDDAPANNKPDDEQPQMLEIHWTAGEAPEHEHDTKWKLTLIFTTLAIILGLAALAFFKFLPLVTTISAGVLVILMAIAMFMVAKKPPRDIDYVLTEQGITIDGQLHPFAEFRAYGVREVGALWELVLIPVKRFGLGYTAFIQDDQGEAIVDALGARIPMEKVDDTWIDRLSRAMKL